MTNTLEPTLPPAGEPRRSPTSFLEGNDAPVDESGPGIFGLLALVVGFALIGWRFGWNVMWAIGFLLGMIFLHELGHFLTAKRAGMQVTQFFLFFGPRIWSFRRGETEYGIRAIPLGAFVKITGMSNAEPVDPEIESRTYRQKSYGSRMSVALAGSAMHFLIALLAIFGLLITVGPTWDDPGPTAVVGGLTAEGGALAAGVEVGDTIVSIDGQPVELFDDIGTVIGDLGSKTVPVVVERDGELVELEATIGERLTSNGAAALDGALAGERILAIDGTAVASYDEFAALAADRVGETVTLTLDLSPAAVDANDYQVTIEELVTEDATRGFFGVAIDNEAGGVEKIGVGSAIGRTFTEFGQLIWGATKGIATTLWPPNLFSMFADVLIPESVSEIGPLDQARLDEIDQIDPNRLLSPIGAVNVLDQAFENGWSSFFLVFMSINMFIGVFNLIPMLPFDGGHVLIATYEKIRGRNGKRYFADVTKLLPIVYVIFVVLIGIFLLGLYLDISNPI